MFSVISCFSGKVWGDQELDYVLESLNKNKLKDETGSQQNITGKYFAY